MEPLGHPWLYHAPVVVLIIKDIVCMDRMSGVKWLKSTVDDASDTWVEKLLSSYYCHMMIDVGVECDDSESLCCLLEWGNPDSLLWKIVVFQIQDGTFVTLSFQNNPQTWKYFLYGFIRCNSGSASIGRFVNLGRR